ncbi:predicted protein [Chaetoceros tenuissimus]|uniref:Uncharacterized protein n=1 Tax=Chaetoceros tenuissimus TaxID=426638 RepID=A0AAD3GYV5_9STRA|nr:predicted protein [Chaetoceros tenuissimus]
MIARKSKSFDYYYNRENKSNADLDMFPRNLLVCSCDALNISYELEQLKEASKKELKFGYDETDELKKQSNYNEQRIFKLQKEMKLLKKELGKSKDREWSLRKRNSKLISKFDESAQKKKEPAYMRAMFHKTDRRASLPVMHFAKFDVAFTRSSSFSKCEQDAMSNQSSKSITQIRTSDSAEADTESNASSSNSTAQYSTENFFQYRRFRGLRKRRDNSDDSLFQDVSGCSSISRRLSSEDEECVNDHRPLEVQIKEIESKVDEIEELKLKMTNRDLIINCMEETLQTEIRNMQDILVEFERKVQL